MMNPFARRWCLLLLIAVVALADASASRAQVARDDPFVGFDLPDDWEEKFWASPNARALFALDVKHVAELVPTQAGIKFCRCPACDADEGDDPLASWSVAAPKVVTCRACGVTVPNDKFPALVEKEKDKKTIPEEAVEVFPGVTHHYPYQELPPEKQRYPEERLYLRAKADYEAREYLSKAALYAAVRYKGQQPGRRDANLAAVASVLILRFAQTYPSYAVHDDQPRSPKFFQKADLAPPYRAGHRTAKWDWSGSLDVPLNLVVAYALLRDDPAFLAATEALKIQEPARRVERDLFRASAEFSRRQPEDFGEKSLQATRGFLAVGRLLNDDALVADALTRLERFTERGFYHDGLWRQGGLAEHRRIVAQFDGWIRLLTAADPARRQVAGRDVVALARAAGTALLTDPPSAELARASWPGPASADAAGGPMFLGGAGVARLSVGRGDDALDVELRDLDAFGPDRVQRQALRLAVGGRPVLDDLDEHPPVASGFNRSTLSRNTVVVDNLNHRESLETAREPAPGGNFHFFAADADFQVVTLDDGLAYPQSTTRYRQTLIASAGPKSRYALSVFEVDGGLQHDQIFQGPVGGRGTWLLNVRTSVAPTTLLPPGMTFVAGLPAESGRWFVQSLGEFVPVATANIAKPAQAGWTDPSGARGGLNLHVLVDRPATLVTATTPDPSASGPRGHESQGRASLVVRRRSGDGSTLRSTFVTLFEPVSRSVTPLNRVGRVKSDDGVVVVHVETADGPEEFVVNLSPGKLKTTRLADGSALNTDGIAVRVGPRGLALAGGTFAEVSGRRVGQRTAQGAVTGVAREHSANSLGWFQTDTPAPAPETLAGRVAVIVHADGTARGWTLDRVENTAAGARYHVREEPGFALEPNTGRARYYQFPRGIFAGPHRLRVGQIARTP